jgi:hypothetical protein
MTGAGGPITWRAAPAALRTLARWITIVQIVGYTTSLVFVWRTTRLAPAGVAVRYRGENPEAGAGAMQFPKSFAEMLTITHTHLLGMAVIFALSGIGVALCTWPSERWRRLLIAEPLGALLVSFAAMWLMRYVDPRFAWLLEASSSLVALTFYVQAYLILRELARVEREEARHLGEAS